MVTTAAAAILLGYLPGALAYRLPFGDRGRRAALDAEERVYWHVTLSVTWSLSAVLVLAAFEVYTFPRLLWLTGAACAALLLAGRSALGYRGTAAGLRWTVVLPIALVALAGWRFAPVSEYIIGGKDPGVYINEGIQIAQRGSLLIHDRVVADVPAFARPLFFPLHYSEDYESTRFMGVFVRESATGEVVGQFPHLFPASIAIGYGFDGLTGARRTIAVWAMLGLVGVYFLTARLFGRPTAAAAATLLALHVTQVWFARYPNSDVVLQASLFAGLLAVARAHEDDQPWFGVVAGWIIGLQLFNRTEALLLVVACIAATALPWAASSTTRWRWRVLLPLAAVTVPAFIYLTTWMRAYFWRTSIYLESLPVGEVAAAVGAAAVGLAAVWWLRRTHPDAVRRYIPWSYAGILIVLALYAFWFREPGGRLIDRDAYALRNFVGLYLGATMFVLALAGLAMAGRQRFWRHPSFFLAFAAFAVFLLYKIHIVEEHFWLSRRFIPIILPGSLILGCAAALSGSWRDGTWTTRGRLTLGAALVGVTGWQYQAAAAPVLPHVEYRDIIPYVETLAASFGPRDLVLVESRDAGSDVHVLGLPVAYIYARPVLVLATPVPDRVMFREFLTDALTRYDRVLFVGTGGTTLLSRQVSATPLASDRVQVDEFEVTTDRLPTQVRRKEFDYGVYQLALRSGESTGPFVLDLGSRDDLHVLRFHAKESTEGRSIRWTQDASEVAITGLTGAEREIVITMGDGGRPAGAEPAAVEILFGDVPLGRITLTAGFADYRLEIPPALAEAAGRTDEPATLRLVSTVWSPRALLGADDDRELGVMVDRIVVR